MAKFRKIKKAPEQLSSILNRVLETPGKKIDLEKDKVFAVWDQCVGPDVAKNARPSSFKDGLLIVPVTSAPWSQQLEYEKLMIIDRINAALGKRMVIDIRFKTGLTRKKSGKKHG